MKKGISTLWTVVITAVIMALTAGGGLYYQHRQNQQKMNELSDQIELLQNEVSVLEKSDDSITNTSTEEANDTSNTSNSEPATAASNPFDLNALKNSYYRINDSLEQKMVNGSFTYDGVTYTLDEEYVAYGYGTDGVIEEAALILKGSTGGTGVFKHIVLMAKKGTKATFLAESYLGDRIQINSISIPSRDKIALNITTFGPNDPSCCPSLVQDKTYTYTSGTSLQEK